MELALRLIVREGQELIVLSEDLKMAEPKQALRASSPANL